MSLYAHAHTLYWFYRPFGAAIIVGAWDDIEKSPKMYMFDAMGEAHKYYAVACGKSR